MRSTKAPVTSKSGGYSRFADEYPFPVHRVSSDETLIEASVGSWLLPEHWKSEPGGTVPEELGQAIQTAVRIREKQEEVEVQIGFMTLLVVIAPVPEKGYANVFGLDVTSRKHAEKKLPLNSQVFENASEGVVITDADGRILDVNRALSAITGYSREEILGENIRILQSGRHDAKFCQEFWETLTERKLAGETWDKRKNGEVHRKWLSVSSSGPGSTS